VGTPIAFRPEAAQPFDDRCLSWQYDARTVSIWTVDGRMKGIRFACSPDQLKTLVTYRKGESDLRERPRLPGREVVPHRHLRHPRSRGV
jgi:hypothetical protein